MLIAATNPCPCGFAMSSVRTCQCTPLAVQKYLGKISGPLLDRIDIHLQVPTLKTQELLNPPLTECSRDIKNRTSLARQIQQNRFSEGSIRINAQMTSSHIKDFCNINEEAKDLLKNAIERLGLSARAHDKILKVARTIADLEESQDIETPHIAEAIGYRALDRTRQ
jgi:magnesium chelatase family protein